MSNETKHTPGPWQVDDHFSCHMQIKAARGIIAETECYRHIDDETTLAEIRANARLIAAAPELLEALRFVNDLLIATNDRKDMQMVSCRAKVQAAITKAEQH